MRKQTAQRTRKRRKQPGLIAQDLSAPQSATSDSVLDNHSHRTELFQRVGGTPHAQATALQLF